MPDRRFQRVATVVAGNYELNEDFWRLGANSAQDNNGRLCTMNAVVGGCADKALLLHFKG